MKDIVNRLLTMLEQHFEKTIEIGTLVFIFVFGAVMLARFPNDEMARWIEGGAIITVIARGMGGKTPPPAPPDPPREDKP